MSGSSGYSIRYGTKITDMLIGIPKIKNDHYTWYDLNMKKKLIN